MKAIHNKSFILNNGLSVVQNIKDTIFWKQFTTFDVTSPTNRLLFRISKIQFFESNSQPLAVQTSSTRRCSEYQRYNFLKAIHNVHPIVRKILNVVQNIKDTIFWKQFTTLLSTVLPCSMLFRISKIQFFESNSQLIWREYYRDQVVQNIKDTIFWKQFTTIMFAICSKRWLFRISKIQFFESNSQLKIKNYERKSSCSEYQRYNFLKAIHNEREHLHVDINGCSEYQRYNFLKAIHNRHWQSKSWDEVVQNIKDTIFWKQFTTNL